MVESIEPDEEGNRDYLTVIEDEVKSDAKEDSEVYKLDESEKVEYSSDNIDQINRLYVGNTGRDKIEADFVCYRCRRNILDCHEH